MDSTNKPVRRHSERSNSNAILFLLLLFLLLLNDLLLKTVFHNSITGKLSDFAGLFVFALSWTLLFPRKRLLIFITTALLFVWWKSPLSGSFIDAWNTNGVLTLSRVVDYGDLFALLILPFAWKVQIRIEDFRGVKIHPALVFGTCAFAFAATSYLSEVPVNKTYTFNYPVDTLKARMNALNVSGEMTLKTDKTLTEEWDTVRLGWLSSQCNWPEAEVRVRELSAVSSALDLLTYTHHCPANDVNNDSMLLSFEEKVIERLR